MQNDDQIDVRRRAQTSLGGGAVENDGAQVVPERVFADSTNASSVPRTVSGISAAGIGVRKA